jgi:predicted DNA-binding transcriptional regulator YafY
VSDPVPRLKRLLTLIPLIRRSSGITIDELARLLKTSRKDIVADLHRLMLCGVPPYQPHDYISVVMDGDRISIDYADHFERPASLSVREALALRVALESFPPGDDDLDRAKSELKEAIDRTLRAKGEAGLSEELDGRLTATTSDDVGKKLVGLREAHRRRRPIDIVYYSVSSDKTAPRRVNPWGLGEHSGNHYLVAFDVNKGDLRHFRVDRIASFEEASATEPSYEIDKGFDLAAFMKKGFGPKSGQPIRLRFAATIARFVKEEYDGYPLETLPSGEVVVELQAGSVTWAVSRALQHGEHVEVLSPPEARAEMQRRLEAIASRPAR